MRKIQCGLLLLALWPASVLAGATQPQATTGRNPIASLPARWRHHVGSTSGTLQVSPNGATFTPQQGASHHWSWNDIETADLFAGKVKWVAYTHRTWPMPGRRVWRFQLEKPLSATTAARIAGWIGRPVRNGVPDPSAPAWLSMPAHHDGAGGMLRLRTGGIDFISARPHQSRSWRWRDVETLGRPDSDHLVITGDRDTWSIALARPLPAAAWDRLWDELYGQGLELGVSAAPQPGRRP